MIQSITLLIIGFVLLIKGADLLVNGASSLAKRYNVSELVIGLTIVAFGTSAPELIVNIVASAHHYDEVVFGNIIGSNIFNLLMILGIAGVIYPVTVQVKTIWNEIPYSLFSAIILLVLVNDTFLWRSYSNMFSRLDGIILLFFFGLFLFYVFYSLKSEKKIELTETKILSLHLTILYIVLGLGVIIFGGRFVVNNAVEIAKKLYISEKLIGLTIVSIGTSLPELATSAVAAFKKKSDLAIGNVIGSNIFNVLLILGISGIISPLRYNSAFSADILVLIFVTLFLFVAMFTGVRKKLDRWEAAILLLFFIGYMSYLIYRK